MAIDLAEIIKNYVDLLIVQYNNKPKARGTIEEVAKQALADGIYWDVLNAFDIETAVGKQLDIIGKYIGVDRFYESVNLSDDVFRFVIKLKIIQNNINHSSKEITDSLFRNFGLDLICQDNLDMTISYFVINPDIIPIVQLSIVKELIPRPMGVEIDGIFINDGIFGFADAFDDDIPAESQGFIDAFDADPNEGIFIGYEDIF